jgi:pimeloyl-ACP methyl ester carboxylesterase
MTAHGASAGAPSFDVTSTDGTPIHVEVGGAGPPIVLVHGSLRDHTIFDPLVADLRPTMTTFAVDRRGFGRSGDGDRYSIEQEFRDVAAVVDAVAAVNGPVTLWGHSYGAGCAMGAAALTGAVSHLVLYEPGLGIAYPEGWIDAHERRLADGDREGVIRGVLTDILGMSEAEVEARRASAEWPDYLRAASTVLREARTENGWEYRAGAFDGIRARVLMLVGTETAPALMRAALRAVAAMPRAAVQVLDGHGHLACLTHPALIASIVTRFARG